MELYDQLTEEDLKTLRMWIESNRSCIIPDMRQMLHYWNKNKRTMFKLLGNKLRVKIPIDIETDSNYIYRNIREIYIEPSFFIEGGKVSFDDCENEFINDISNYISSFYENNGLVYPNYDAKDWGYKIKGDFSCVQTCNGCIHSKSLNWTLPSLFFYSTVLDGTLRYTYNFMYKGKRLTLPSEMKYMRGIQKFLKFIEYPNMHLFENWRNQISDLTTTRNLKANLVLSVHPLDFLTLSDNACGWKSCLKFRDAANESYAMAITEMMNSNCVIVAYLESNHKKFIHNYCEIPNKSFRQLFVCHKDIILAGKSYPYWHDDLTHLIISYLQTFAGDNLGWKYQYGPQRYVDTYPFQHNQGIKRVDIKKKTKHRNILICTDGYYNDWAESDSDFWCVRNWVPKTKRIKVSGPATCLVCGNRICTQDEIWAEYTHDNICDMYGHGFCNNCMSNHYCNHCGIIDPTEYVYIFRETPTGRPWSVHRQYCKDCVEKELVYNAEIQRLVPKESLLTQSFEYSSALDYIKNREENGLLYKTPLHPV